MRRHLGRHLNYANVTATLALVFAMSGGALAAKHYLLSSTKQISPSVLKSFASSNAALFKKLAQTITVAKASSAATAANATVAGTATSATHAEDATNATHATDAKSATHAVTADTATSATNAVNATRAATAAEADVATNAVSATTAAGAATAGNALSLGGVAASGYTRSDCASQTGQIKGFVKVPGSGLTTTLSPIGGGYSCSGQPILARRLELGEYEVEFEGNPATIAMATVNAGSTGPAEPFPDLVSVESIGSGVWRVAVYNAASKEFRDDSFQLLLP